RLQFQLLLHHDLFRLRNLAQSVGLHLAPMLLLLLSLIHHLFRHLAAHLQTATNTTRLLHPCLRNLVATRLLHLPPCSHV
ncbi:hypothetical protein DXG01_012437, partial [Tephrocybe rancida]